MQNFFRQNRNILVVALSVFIVSMTALMFFLNNTGKDPAELKTDVLQTDSAATIDPEKQYQDLFQSGDDPFAVMKLDGHMTFVSSQFLASTGFTNDDLQGKLFFSLIDSQDLTTFFSAFGKVVETGKAVTMIGPFGLANKDGEYKTSMGSVLPVMEDGKVAKIGIIIKDISNEVQDSGVAAPAVTNDVTPAVTTSTVKKTTNIQKTVKPADPQGDSPATQWKKPKTLKTNDPSWITGGKLVMLLPFNLPLFPAHLLLAQM